MKRFAALLFAVVLMLPVLNAGAEDVFRADLYSQGRLQTDKDYLCVVCDQLDADGVSLSVTGPDGLVYMKNYGPCSGKFRSDRICLSPAGSAVDYDVTATVGGETYRFTVCRTQASSGRAEARTEGEELPDGNEACVLDDGGTGSDRQTVSVYTSDGRYAGTVMLRLEDGRLTATADPEASVSVCGGTVYATRDTADCARFGSSRFGGMTGALGESIRVGGSGPLYVCVILDVGIR